jgi:O-antigen/teichoic acid export membrane protein
VHKKEQTIDPQNHKDAKDLILGAVFYFLGLLARISKVIFVFVAARFYGAHELGLYFLAYGLIDIASKFGLWGVDRSLIRDIVRYNTDRSETTKDKVFGIMRFNLGLAFGLSVLVAAILFFSAPLLAKYVFDDIELITPARLMALSLPFSVLTFALVATTKALRTMQYETLIRQGLEPLVLLIATLIFIPFKLGAVGLVTAQVIASFVTACTAFAVVMRKYRYLGWRRQPLSKEMKMETIRYTSPIAAMDSLNLMVARIDIMVIGALLNSAAVGLYGIAVEIISIIKRIRQGFEPIFFPIVSESFYQKQQERLQRNYVLVTRWLLAGTLLPLAAMLLFSNQLLSFFDVKSSEAAAALMILALAHGVWGIFSAAESLLVMAGKTLLNTGYAVVMLLITFSASMLLIPVLGLPGAALGTFVAFTTISLVRMYQVYRKFHLMPFSHALVWPLITAMITITVFYLLSHWLTIQSTVGTIVALVVMALFYAALYFSGAAEPEELHLISRIKEKVKTFVNIATKKLQRSY